MKVCLTVTVHKVRDQHRCLGMENSSLLINSCIDKAETCQLPCLQSVSDCVHVVHIQKSCSLYYVLLCTQPWYLSLRSTLNPTAPSLSSDWLGDIKLDMDASNLTRLNVTTAAWKHSANFQHFETMVGDVAEVFSTNSQEDTWMCHNAIAEAFFVGTSNLFALHGECVFAFVVLAKHNQYWVQV